MRRLASMPFTLDLAARLPVVSGRGDAGGSTSSGSLQAAAHEVERCAEAYAGGGGAAAGDGAERSATRPPQPAPAAS